MRLLRIIIIAIASLTSLASEAQIVLGGNFSWECLGANQYEVTFTLYRDCFGTSGDPTSTDVLVYPSGCASVPFSATLNLVSSTEISDLCPTELVNSSCGGVGATPGTLQVVYTGIITLDPGCVWNILWNSFDWSLLYSNQDPVFLQDAYINSLIDTNQPCNDSPVIVSTPSDPQVPYICDGDAYSHALNINIPAGLSCTYAFNAIQTTGVTPDVSVDVPGYTVPAGVTIDPLTGVIDWPSAIEGYYSFNIEIQIFDGVNYVGTMFENMTILVRDCSPTDTQFTIPEVTSNNNESTLTGNNNLQVCVGDSLIFTVEATNPELFRGIDLSFTPIPGLPITFTQSGVNPAVGTFSLLATESMVLLSPYSLQIHAEDDFCPIPDVDDIIVNITISPNVYLLNNDTTICFGDNVNLVAAGLGTSNYQWSVLPGGDATGVVNNVSSLNLTPDFTTSYRVTAAGVPANCASSDTATVSVAMTDLTFATNSESCGNVNGSIDLVVQGDGSGNYDFDWTGTGTVDGQEDQSGLDGGVGVTYSVIVTDNVYGCTLNESVNVSEIAQPAATISNDTTICNTQSTNLVIDFTAGQGPFDIDFTVNPANPVPADVVAVNDPYSVTLSPTVNTTYTIVSITDAFGCVANLNQDYTITVRNPVTTTIQPEADICVGDDLVLELDHSAAGSYAITYSINGVNEPVVVVADNGTIDINPDPATNGNFTYDIEQVAYQNAPACPSNDLANGSIVVVVDPLPTAVLSGNGSACDGDCYTLEITLTGDGPWTVDYTIGGIAQAPLVIADAPSPYIYDWVVCPANDATYCITNVEDSNCENPVVGECATITMNPYPVVNYSISNTDLCTGNCADIDVTVAPAGTFSIVFTDTPNDPGFTNTYANETSPFSVPICPTQDITYRLDSVFFTGVPECATVLSQSILVEVSGEIAVTATDTICNNTSTQYQVVYTVSGGELPYDEAPGGTGGAFNVAGTVFTSSLVNSGVAGGSWTFSDVNDCNTVTMNMGIHTCPIISNAGTMVLTPQVICGTAAAPGAATGQWNNNGVLDGNDQQMYILHTVANNTVGVVVASDCNDATFGDVDSPLAFGGATAPGVIVSGTTYYISSVVGDDSGVGVGGCVNLAAANVQIAPGQPVTWYQRPVVNYTISDTELCATECATINVTVTPANPFSIQFSENPSDAALGLAIGQNSPFSYIICPTETTVYTLDSVFITAAPQCVTVVNQDIQVNLNEEIEVEPTDTICNNIGTQYQVVYSITGGELPYDEDPAGDGGAFDVGGTNFTTAFINSGSGDGPWTFSDVNDCNAVSLSINPYVCPVLTDAGTMSLTPVEICGGEVSPNSAAGTWNNDGFLDGNDAQMFILHTTANNTQGVIIATDCDDAIFGDVDSPLAFGAAAGPGTIVSGATYYISSVAGDASGVGVGGCVNLAAANVDIANGQPVIWYQASTATLNVVGDPFACADDCVTLSVDFTGQGPWTFEYSIDGVVQPSVNVAIASNPYQFCVDVAGQYCLETVTNGPADCTGSVNGCINVDIYPLPTAVFDGPGETCQFTDYCFEVDFTGTAPWTFTVNDPDAVNDVVAPINDDPYQYCVSAAGPYQIISVTDGNGCTGTTASPIENVVVNALPTVQWSFGDTTICEGSCIDLTIVSTGASTFDVDIISADPNVTSAGLQNIGSVYDITVCEPGDYELVQVVDDNGCVSLAGDILHIDEIPTPTADAGADLDQCVGLPIIIGTAALPGHDYSWSPTTGIPVSQQDDAMPEVTINTAGVYTYTVTASVAQCSSTDNMELTIHALPVIDITPADDSICFNTCTDLTASGADSYTWDASPSITTLLTGATVTVCPASDESFNVTGFEIHNAIQCESTASIDIVVGEEITNTVDFSPEVCFNQCDGFADFTINGGFEPYTVDGLLALSWTDLCAGIYNYQIEDEQGCTLDGSFEITERPEEIIDVITPINPLCFGENTGSLEFTDASATDFTLDMPNGAPDLFDDTAPFEFFGLGAGVYTAYMNVELSSGLQCADTSTITLVSVSPEMTITVPWTEEQTCFGEQICFEADIEGGLGGLTTHWNTCEECVGCESSTSNIYCINITQDTVLYVYGTDQNLCSTDTLSMAVSLFPDIALLLQGGEDSVEVCEYSCIDLYAVVAGGNGNVNLEWYEIPVDNAPISSNDSLEVCPVYSSPFIDYYVIADDGCSTPVIDTVRVIVHDYPEVIISSDTTEACYPDSISFIYELDPSFTDNHSCTWYPGTGFSYNYCGDTTFLYTFSGTFYPNIAITSEYGCVGTDTLDDPLVIHGLPEVDFTWEPQPVDILHLEVQFINLSEGEDSVRWNFYNAGYSTSNRPMWTFPDIETTSPFEVCLEAINEFNCKDTLCQDVYIENVLQVFVPNSFTPDADGINDVFIPIVNGVNPDTYKFWIFNRWGDPVYYTEIVGDAWTGESDDGEYYVPDGVYLWRMECEAIQDKKIEVFEGHVTILR